MKRLSRSMLATGLMACSSLALAQAAAPALTPGQPIDTRPPEKADDKPAFAGQTRAPYHQTPAPVVTTVTTKLSSPWSLAFLPDGKVLVTEKPGSMRVVDASGTLSAPVSGVPPVAAIGQGGLLDVALDPKFATNHRIFFSFAKPADGDNSQIAIAHATFDEASLALTDVQVIFSAVPALPSQQSANQGSRLAIDKQGNLFATIGDRSKSPPWNKAQELDTHLGKVIHITPDGKPAPGNPFLKTAGALPEIWSIGHRSEEGLTIDPATGTLWELEHGPRGGDELNKVQAGKNYGWPVVVHGIDYPGTTIGGGITAKAGMEQPVYYWDPVIAPSGLAVYNGKLFPQWKGNVFVGALRGMALHRLTLANGKVVAEEPLLADQHSRIRDVRVGPEGALYVLTDDGKLLRLTPK